jgi:hypothetical protein
MFKKLLSSLVILLIAMSFKTNAQCTIDSSYTNSGYYPSSLPDATVNVAYDETVQVVIPTDTVLQGFTFTITQVVIDSIGGLPSGINYSCNPTNCIFSGNSNNCIELTGTATVSGTYPLTVYYQTKAKNSIFGTQTLPGEENQYTLTVTQLTSLNETGFQNSLSFGNVFISGNKNEVQYYSPVQKTVNLKIYNMLGNLVFSQDLKSYAGLNKATFNSLYLQSGIYIISLSEGNNKVSKRISAN